MFDQSNSEAFVKSLGIITNLNIKNDELRTRAYVIQIRTVIHACQEASMGGVRELKAIKETTKMDFNTGDYDKKTPLHVAVVFN